MRINELDVAVWIIFASGAVGCVIEPWSVQAKMMVACGIIFFCARFTVLMVRNYCFSRKGGRR